jgi:phage gp45-like
MIRSRLASTAQRAFSMIARATLVKADDSKKWQEVTIRSEVRRMFTNVEVAHPYGFTSVGLPPADDNTSDVAEVIVVYPDGDMSHPVALIVGDRRYRLKNCKEGESAIYDDQGQKVHITRDGIAVNGGPSKKPLTVTVGNAVLTVKDGQILANVDGTLFSVKPGRIDMVQVPAPLAMMTESGPSTKIFGVM